MQRAVPRQTSPAKKGGTSDFFNSNMDVSMKITKKAGIAGLFSLALLAAAPAAYSANCTFRSSSEFMGSTQAGSVTEAFGPFTQTCTGGMSASITNIRGGRDLRLQIEKEVNGSWQVVSSGSSVSYPGEPGRYRFTVTNYGTMGLAQWSLKYSKMG